MYYIGEVKELPINELVKQFPQLSEEEIKDLGVRNVGKIPKNRALSKQLIYRW